DLDQPQAFERLSRPGTLAVMPSLGETFSNAVYECLERGIPFIASDAGAPAELVAPEDRERVLFEPSSAGVAAALPGPLAKGNARAPAHAAFEPTATSSRWAEIVELPPSRRPAGEPPESVLLGGDAVLDDDCVATLTRAQAVSGADVVTCGI